LDDLATKAVDAWVKTLEEERQPDGKWHPSSISSPCMRAALLQKQGVEPSNPPNDQTKRVFRIGHIFHEFVQEAISNQPAITLALSEVKVAHPLLEVEGAADMLVAYGMTNELIEIKSIKDSGLNYGIPKPEHLMQAGIYTFCLRENGGTTEDGIRILPIGDRLTRMRFVYVGKETMTIREKVVEYTEELEDRILKRIGQLREYEKMGELPLAIAKDSWYTRYCQYKGSGNCCGDK